MQFESRMKMRCLLVMMGLPVLVLSACATEVDDDDDHEEEPVDTATDAIISDVDCRTTRQQAYDRGSPYGIDVIKVGGKPTSKATGHAFLKMQKAAHAAGVRLTINSGFRTMAEQQYFYNCYQTRRCNNGNLAARPGYSNHQNGRALDLTTSSWLANNASRFGFKRTVPSEAWHYEFFGSDPGGPCAAGGGGSTNPAPDPPAPPSGGNASSGNGSSPTGGGQPCSSDGQCNPGNDGSGLICNAGADGTKRCVPGCRSNAQCPGVTTCSGGQCR
ncbi:MAG: M15 family metallopeptidase [Labilithrix sp.]|nr:M15 family metallopeptidase [Labilithrix sp.]